MGEPVLYADRAAPSMFQAIVCRHQVGRLRAASAGDEIGDHRASRRTSSSSRPPGGPQDQPHPRTVPVGLESSPELKSSSGGSVARMRPTDRCGPVPPRSGFRWASKSPDGIGSRRVVPKQGAPGDSTRQRDIVDADRRTCSPRTGPARIGLDAGSDRRRTFRRRRRSPNPVAKKPIPFGCMPYSGDSVVSNRRQTRILKGDLEPARAPGRSLPPSWSPSHWSRVHRRHVRGPLTWIRPGAGNCTTGGGSARTVRCAAVPLRDAKAVLSGRTAPSSPSWSRSTIT